jgi:dipeptide transport system substrate-binding protein
MKMKAFVRAAAATCVAWAMAGAAQAAGTVSFCSDSAPEGFDIAQFETIPTQDAAGLTIYDALLQMKPGTTEVVPGIVERWETSADGRVYTLHLRHGVKFHDTAWFHPTRELNADDVIWSVQRINDPHHPAHAAAPNGYPYWAGMSMNKLIQSIDKLDPMTVRITLTHADAAFPADLTMTNIAAVYSAEYGAQLVRSGHLEWLDTKPIGTGPYVFKSYVKDAVIRYDANKAYWGGAPGIDHLVFAITLDTGVLVQRLKAGECQVAVIANDKAGAFAGDPRFNIADTQSLMTVYVSPNAKHGVLGDKRFREALSLAIDRDAIVKAVYSGSGEPAGSFLPPGMWGRDASIRNPQDVARAKALVKASGYDGRELTLFTVAARSDNKRFAELLQADWAAIGVKVKLRLMEVGELYKRTGAGEHDLALLSWFSDNGDPDNFLTPNLSCAAVGGGGNKSQWCNPAFDRLLAQARATTDIAQRTAIYQKAQQMIHDETALIPVAHRHGIAVVDKRVSGFVLTPFLGSSFRAARLN